MEIEIPFGAFDSELMHQEINIPEGFEATIEGNKIILTKTESEDEQHRKWILEYLYDGLRKSDEQFKDQFKCAIAWLEKQAEQTSSQTNERAWLYLVSDVLTWKDGIGQYLDDSRVQELAKKLCSEYAQKLYNPSVLSHSSNTGNNNQEPADNVEPKFKVGDWVVQENTGVYKVIEVCESWYEVVDNKDKHYSIGFDKEYMCHLWTIKDAKPGDVLTCYSDIKGQPIEQTGIIKQYVGRHGGCSNSFKVHVGVDWDNNVVIEGYMGSSNIYPSTKEQRELLFKKMREAGYEWDDKEKKPIKSEVSLPSFDEQQCTPIVDIPFGARDSELQEASYHIPEGFHAEIQGDKVVIKKGKKKSSWSEEDENILKNLTDYFMVDDCLQFKEGKIVKWLESLKQRMKGE